jgi:hypothetical protein
MTVKSKDVPKKEGASTKKIIAPLRPGRTTSSDKKHLASDVRPGKPGRGGYETR